MPVLDAWSQPAIAQLQGGTTRAGLLFRLSTAPVVRLWGGIGDLEVDPDLIELEVGAVHAGIGELTGLPQLSQLINGVAERVEFSLAGAGVTAQVAALAGAEAEAVRGAELNIGLLVFDANWQRLSPVLWLWAGVADMVGVSRGDQKGQPVRTISLSAGSLLTGRRRPGHRYFTDADQRRRSPDDAFFDRVKLYNAGTTKTWPT